MSNSASQKAMSMAVIATMFSASLCPMCIPQRPFEIQLPSSQNKTIIELPKSPYDKFMEVVAKEKKKREVEKAAKELARVKAEEEARIKAEEEAKLKRTIVVNSDSGTAISRGGSVNTRQGSYIGSFKLTAYNLSEGDCEKSPNDPYFGIASSGYDFKGKDLRCRKIAVDTRVIPMGSTVYLEFPQEYNVVTLPDGTRFELSGSYQAVDVGGAIKGNKIDLFVGGTSHRIERLCNDIGVRQVKVYR